MTFYDEGLREGRRRAMADLRKLENELEKTKAALALALKRLNRYEVPHG